MEDVPDLMLTKEDALRAWFCQEVLPLERSLTAFIRRNWRTASEVCDLRQDIYERVLEGARSGIPTVASAYVYTVARNHLISLARRERIVSMDYVADMEALPTHDDPLTPERYASSREELRRVQSGLDNLPVRCREIISMRKVEGLSSREVAQRLGIGIDAVDKQTSTGMRALVDFMRGGEGKVHRPIRAKRERSGRA